MKLRQRKAPMIPRSALSVLSLTLLSLAWLSRCFGQGTVTFDGPPTFLGGILVDRYEEAGMSFMALTNVQNYGGFSRWHSSLASDLPYNGTAYIQASSLSPVQFTSTAGSLFGLLSVDLAEQGQVIPDPVTVVFTGYHVDGSSVTATFTTDGIIGDLRTPDFQTFYFGAEFSSGLTHVIISRPEWALWSLDNVVVSIPEPGIGALLVLAAALFTNGRFRGGN